MNVEYLCDSAVHLLDLITLRKCHNLYNLHNISTDVIKLFKVL